VTPGWHLNTAQCTLYKMFKRGHDTRFSTSVFFSSSNKFPLAPDTRVQVFFNIASNSQRYSTKLVVHVTVGSMTPLCLSRRCQWHLCATNFAEYLFEWSETLVFRRISNSAAHGIVVYPILVSTTVLLTPLWHAQRCQCHCCANMTPLCQWS
jgi:hypothetical protein